MRLDIITRLPTCTNREQAPGRSEVNATGYAFLKRGEEYGKFTALQLGTAEQLFTLMKGTFVMRKETMALMLLAVLITACNHSSTSNNNSQAETPQAANEVKDSDGNTPLLTAVNVGNGIEARRLIEEGADVNAANNTGITPLMNAAGMGDKDLVELLIKKGADVNHRTPGNYTPLMQAALVGQTEIVKVLLDAGADPAVKDTGGRSAISYAEDQKKDEIVKMLKQRTSAQSAGKK